jgi:hypothetical protein
MASAAAWHSSISNRLAGHHQGARGLVQAVVGAADPLDHPRGPLGRGQLDDQVDVAPVDAHVQRRGADHGPQLAARHGRLDLAPLLGRQAAVVQGDGQVVVVQLPQLWNANSAWKRVLTKIRAVWAA